GNDGTRTPGQIGSQQPSIYQEFSNTQSHHTAQPSSFKTRSKNGLDAFEDTDLTEHLSGLDVIKVVIVGISTAHGIAATAATAVALGYEVVVVFDATASVSVVEHTTALDQLAGLGVTICSVEDALTE
ncbi:MAG: isochorismatase family protein, partial [Mycobacteriales bacterium]